MMARAVVHQRVASHEDFVIVSINPLPANALHFPVVCKVVEGFLEEHKNVRIRDIQCTHLGQALVRFVHLHDRDALVIGSPHHYGDVEFSFVKHNQLQNWLAMNFNRECWLMLMGFPLDLWDGESI
jgi:hypothetical protein